MQPLGDGTGTAQPQPLVMACNHFVNPLPHWHSCPPKWSKRIRTSTPSAEAVAAPPPPRGGGGTATPTNGASVCGGGGGGGEPWKSFNKQYMEAEVEVGLRLLTLAHHNGDQSFRFPLPEGAWHMVAGSISSTSM